MKTPRETRLDQALTGPSYPEPPEQLLDSILEEIPDPGEVSPATDATGESANVVNLASSTGSSKHNDDELEARVLDGQDRFGATRTQIALIAATLLAILGAGYLAFRLGGTSPRAVTMAAESDATFADAVQPSSSPAADPETAPAGSRSRPEPLPDAQPTDETSRVQARMVRPAESRDLSQVPTTEEAERSRRFDQALSASVAPPNPAAPAGRSSSDETAFHAPSQVPAGETGEVMAESEKLKQELEALGYVDSVNHSTVRSVDTDAARQDARQRIDEAQRRLRRQQDLLDRDLITPSQVRKQRDEIRAAQEELRALGGEASAAPAEGLTEAITVTSNAPVAQEQVARHSGAPAREPAATPSPRAAPAIPEPEPKRDTPTEDDEFRPERPRQLRNWVDPSIDPVSTFGLDVDTGSYTQVRGYLDNGQLPPRGIIRAEEMLNFFDYGDEPPQRGDFRVTAQAGPTPFSIPGHSTENRIWVRFGIAGREISAEDRKPAMLTLLIDTSGSMRQNGRLEMVKRSLSDMIEQLRDDDSIAIVTYSDTARVLLNPTSDRNEAREAIRRLHPGGSTNLAAGMREAYRLAERAFEDRAINRVILCSDGVANVGETEAVPILRQVADWAARGIELTTVGVGMGDYNDALLERLADRGDGRYAYVDGDKEAHRFFVENLTGTLQTIAADARVQVTFDPDVVRWYRQVGYENRALPDSAFRNPNTDAGEIGAGHRVTVLYEVELQPNRSRSTRNELATLALRYRSQDSGRFEEQSVRVLTGDVTSRFERAYRELQLAVVVGSFADALRDRTDMASQLEQLFPVAQDLGPLYRGRTEVAELVALIGEARDLSRRAGR